MDRHQPGPKYKQQKFYPFAACWIISIIVTWFLLLGIVILDKRWIYNELRRSGSPGDIGQVYQIVDDWNKSPFVELTVIEGNEQCPSEQVPVFNNEWKGTEMGCWIEDLAYCGGDNKNRCTVPLLYGFVETWLDFDTQAQFNSTHPVPPHIYSLSFRQDEVDKIRTEECRQIFPEQPILQTSVKGKTVCGKPGGAPFATVQRPELVGSEYLCPSGTSPCSPVTSPENTVCYPGGATDSSCPITEIFFAGPNLNATIINDTAYTVETYSETDPDMRYLVYSKTKTDNLPLTTTTVNSRPCLNPNKVELPREAYYPTELDRGEFCGANTDPRYVSNGGEDVISNIELQQESGVLELLSNHPYLERSVDLGYRAGQKLSYWSRPTIPWKLECEGTSKEEVIYSLQELNEAIHSQDLVIYQSELLTVLWCGIILLVLEFASCVGMMLLASLSISPLSNSEGDPAAVIVLANGTCCVRCIFFLPILIQAIRIATQVDDVEMMIEQVGKEINNCSDQYTVVDSDLNENEMAYIQLRTGLMDGLTKFVLFLYFCVIVSFVVYLYATFNHTYETDKEHFDQASSLDKLRAEALKSASSDTDYKDEERKWNSSTSVIKTQFVGEMLPPNYAINQGQTPSSLPPIFSQSAQNQAFVEPTIDSGPVNDRFVPEDGSKQAGVDQFGGLVHKY